MGFITVDGMSGAGQGGSQTQLQMIKKIYLSIDTIYKFFKINA